MLMPVCSLNVHKTRIDCLRVEDKVLPLTSTAIASCCVSKITRRSAGISIVVASNTAVRCFPDIVSRVDVCTCVRKQRVVIERVFNQTHTQFIDALSLRTCHQQHLARISAQEIHLIIITLSDFMVICSHSYIVHFISLCKKIASIL